MPFVHGVAPHASRFLIPTARFVSGANIKNRTWSLVASSLTGFRTPRHEIAYWPRLRRLGGGGPNPLPRHWCCKCLAFAQPGFPEYRAAARRGHAQTTFARSGKPHLVHSAPHGFRYAPSHSFSKHIFIPGPSDLPVIRQAEHERHETKSRNGSRASTEWAMELRSSIRR